VSELPRPLNEETLLRMIRYGLATGAERLHLRPGFRPLADGLGGARELRWRQLTGEDTRLAAAALLGRIRVPSRMRHSPIDAGRELFAWFELPGQALVEASFDRAPGGLAISLDLIPLLEKGAEIEVLEG